MLVIRDAQMAALGRTAQESFEVQLAQNLAGTFPERFPDAASQVTVQFVQRAIQVALAHGIATEHAVASFATLQAAFGEQFEWTPVARQALGLLRDSSLPGPVKVAAIRDCLYSATGGRAITFTFGEES
jgi:hypothetical protein